MLRVQVSTGRSASLRRNDKAQKESESLARAATTQLSTATTNLLTFGSLWTRKVRIRTDSLELFFSTPEDGRDGSRCAFNVGILLVLICVVEFDHQSLFMKLLQFFNFAVNG